MSLSSCDGHLSEVVELLHCVQASQQMQQTPMPLLLFGTPRTVSDAIMPSVLSSVVTACNWLQADDGHGQHCLES